MEKLQWHGKITSVQPRIRLSRSFDERWHNYLGFNLRINGVIGDEEREFIIAVGESAHERFRFRIGMTMSGVSVPVNDPRLETAAFYKTSRIKVESTDLPDVNEPPFTGEAPDLPTYRWRGHRRLDPRTYRAKCTTCIWGCRMPVELIIDNWKPWIKDYRFETFCYGPKSCKLYRAGAVRKVPGRNGIVWEEEDWVEEDYTSNRGPDD